MIRDPVPALLARAAERLGGEFTHLPPVESAELTRRNKPPLFPGFWTRPLIAWPTTIPTSIRCMPGRC